MMTRTIVMSLVLATLLVGFGCSQGGGSGDSGTAVPEKVTQAAAIAAEIEASPDQAAAILQKHGMTTDEWTALMYEIAENAEWSDAFEAAR